MTLGAVWSRKCVGGLFRILKFLVRESLLLRVFFLFSTLALPLLLVDFRLHHCMPGIKNLQFKSAMPDV